MGSKDVSKQMNSLMLFFGGILLLCVVAGAANVNGARPFAIATGAICAVGLIGTLYAKRKIETS